jgi:hypothetical protein
MTTMLMIAVTLFNDASDTADGFGDAAHDVGD